MKREGMGRRFSEREVSSDFEQQRRDALDDAFDRAKAEIIEELLAIDQKGKALTGRKTGQYVEESCISEKELFPENARVLNIGDPWQKLDKEDVVNLEYETGEEADFAYDGKRFQESLLPELEGMRQEVEAIGSYDEPFARELAWRVRGVEERVRGGIGVSGYPKESKTLYDVARLIRERHGNDDGQGVSRELWYAAMRLARGFEDVCYTETVINPAIEKEVLRRRGLTEIERQALVCRLVEAFRGKKKYARAELVKGAFPDTPFQDHAFDRVVASWSISAHLFGVMNERQYSVMWNELNRILKRDGAAYIWPLNYWSGTGNEIAASLREHCARGGAAGYVYWDEIDPRVEWIDDARGAADLAYDLSNSQTLVFLPVGAGKETRQRVERSLRQMIVL